MTKITKTLGRIPNWLLLAICTVTNVLNGIFVSKTNTIEASIVKGVTKHTLIILAIIYAGVIFTNMMDKIFVKTYKMKKINVSHSYWLNRTLNSDISSVQKLSTGKLFDTVKDIAILESSMMIYLIWMIPAIIPFITLMKKEAVYNPIMVVISVSSIVLSFVLMMISDRMFGFNTEAKRRKARMQEITADNFFNVKTIKFLGAKKFAEERLSDSQEYCFPYLIRPAQVMYFRIIDIIGTIPLVANIWLSRNNLELLALIVISEWVLNNVRGNLVNFADQYVELKSCRDFLKDLKGDEEPIDEEKFDEIEIKDVFFDYGKSDDDEDIIFNVKDLTIRKGDKFLITGESGEGKSSLANLLSGAIKPSAGYVPKVPVYYVWQETECLADTLRNNIVFDNEFNISDDEIIEYFKKLGMMKWFSKKKDGLDTHIGEKGCKLSSGQKQRINIIRCLIQMKYHPEQLFIMDEITSNLDKKTIKLAINCFNEAMTDDITAMIISHNDGMEGLTNRSIVVENHKYIID